MGSRYMSGEHAKWQKRTCEVAKENMRSGISPCVAMVLISSLFVVCSVSGDRNIHGVSD